MKKAKPNTKKPDLLVMGLLIPVLAGSIIDVVAAEDRLYQIVDGNIDNNTIEGWKTYNGGGCGGCHGRGGSGGVAANLAESQVIKNNDRGTFNNYVINGYPGTLMKPHSNDERVMDNLDNLFNYLKARADGVLGPENLIKYPLGKIE